MAITKHYWISGRVQGVYFRRSTQQRGKDLGLTGWVRNTDDGRVEALASGEEAALETFERWLWQGPDQAQVTSVEAESLPLEEHQDFQVR